MYKLYNGFEIPVIGYGTFPQRESLVSRIPLALEKGYALIDTSDNYCNEIYIGEGLDKAQMPEKIIVVSKFSQPFRTKELVQCFEESKARLSGKLDIYLLHWPYPFLWRAQWRKLEELYLNGKCRAIGVCNFEAKHLRRLMRFCRVRPMIDQFERHPMFQQNEIFQFCQRNGIQVMCYSPVARMSRELVDSKVLRTLAEKYNKTVCQIILRWNIQHGSIPIPGSSSKEHMKENLELFDFSLTDEEIMQMDALEAGMRVRFDPDKRFSLKQKFCFLIHRIRMVFGGVMKA